MADGEGVSQTFVYVILIGTLIAGAFNNIAMKEQDEFIENQQTKQTWNHPFLQVFIMFIAEAICLIAFYLLYYLNTNFKNNHELKLEEAQKQGLKTNVHPLIPYIPACCDITGSSLQFFGLTLINQSIYVMLRGGVPVVTAIFSVAFLGRKLYSHHYLGLSLAIIGIAIVGISQYLDSPSGGSGNIIIGLLCVIGSLFTTGVQFIVEEKILNTFFIPPLKMVGMEGVCGLFLSGGAILVTSFLPCDYSYPAANGDIDPGCNPNGYVEDPGTGVSIIFQNWQMILYVLLGITSLSFFNFCGVSVTKYVSSLARSILTITVTVVVWLFDLLFLDEPFSWLQLIGFLTLVSGNLIYQEIIEIPGLRKNTRKSRAQSIAEEIRQKLDEQPTIESKDIIETISE